MGLFDGIKGKDSPKRLKNLTATALIDASQKQLNFYSTKALEQGLDGTEESFHKFYWAVYHCSPLERSGVTERREELRRQFPEKAVIVGKRFILTGEAAYQAVGGYYPHSTTHA
jgi:hypothetical protein